MFHIIIFISLMEDICQLILKLNVELFCVFTVIILKKKKKPTTLSRNTQLPHSTTLKSGPLK